MPTPKEVREPRESLEFYFGKENKGQFPVEFGKYANQVSLDKALTELSAYYKSQEPKKLGVEEVEQIIHKIGIPVNDEMGYEVRSNELATAICKAQEGKCP